MDSELLKGFYLGDFLVEPAKGRVTGRHGSTHLPPKAMEVLLQLVGSVVPQPRGRLVMGQAARSGPERVDHVLDALGVGSQGSSESGTGRRSTITVTGD